MADFVCYNKIHFKAKAFLVYHHTRICPYGDYHSYNN